MNFISTNNEPVFKIRTPSFYYTKNHIKSKDDEYEWDSYCFCCNKFINIGDFRYQGLLGTYYCSDCMNKITEKIQDKLLNKGSGLIIY
jgi:hypothetical protein